MATPSQDRRPPVDVRGAAVYLSCLEGYVRRLVFDDASPS